LCITEQDFNSHNYARFGTTTVLELGDVTADQLTATINKTVKDEEYDTLKANL
jgi:hypothetical protein